MSKSVGILEPVGILLAVQGIGGTVNNILGDGPSWFLLNHIDALEGFRLPLHVLMAVVGVLLVVGPQLRKWRGDRTTR
ncbi:hypothetical protein [Saccharomonospora sp. NB11]|uniref:hypothetical protein n=1 Tax=Saccharomonospora sp. NB11 TaxID=1642298 RepID=UPI0018D12952|nr:hypothetical protein [Saccharomonospora sp. NB11]